MPTSRISFTPSTTYEQALTAAADIWGIEREYWDIWGNKHIAPADDIRAVLDSLGVAAGSKEDLDRCR